MSVHHVSFIGRSNSGKTTLISRLIPVLRSKNLRIGTIKHTHHQAEFDKPGKDSWTHRNAGSEQTLVMSHQQMALYTDRPAHFSLEKAVQRWFSDFDLVISEGFKNEPGLKIEVFRHTTNKEPLYLDPGFEVQALVSDQKPLSKIPFFRFVDIEMICDWIVTNTGLQKV